MPSRLAPNRAKQYEVRTAALVVDGTPLEDVESFGFDQSKDHEIQYTIDQNAVIVKATPDLSGQFTVLDTSPVVPIIDRMFLRDRPFNITGRFANTQGGSAQNQDLGPGGGQFQFPSDISTKDFIQFSNCMLTDFSQGDHEIDGIPTWTGEWIAVNRQDEEAPDDRQNSDFLATGQLSAQQAINRG